MCSLSLALDRGSNLQKADKTICSFVTVSMTSNSVGFKTLFSCGRQIAVFLMIFHTRVVCRVTVTQSLGSVRFVPAAELVRCVDRLSSAI